MTRPSATPPATVPSATTRFTAPRTVSTDVPEFTEAELLRQPLGYWTGAASAAITGFLNDNLAREGVRQPHWWTLNRVREADGGLTRTELAEVVGAGRPYVDVSVLDTAVDELLERGLLAEAGGRLRVTGAGDALTDHLWTDVVTPALRQVRDGIGDEEYAAVIRLLRRLIRNVEGDAGFRP
ncbi:MULTISPECIES: MarR family winged helix-turn-helix transcriptional regulator [unclassified Streptomyces]|uniref:MarR family winged helix-turn-helix transcriptional regulator n=1 Tax=unclassified Streptomyces TaxID=2593676 RepID=UPI0022B6D61C|nr:MULTISPECIES: hypothetical protein [unclassified Streptomyces]MCZ7414246.1 hypothetical protein [Streptomyces sp. WMMC897]MCZ7431264.1 hypothetical protein [Streptomyces sp. WMMC1477]